MNHFDLIHGYFSISVSVISANRLPSYYIFPFHRYFRKKIFNKAFIFIILCKHVAVVRLRSVMVDKERTEGPVYPIPLSIFVFASPYLIFGKRGKTVWGSSRIANLQNIFYIRGELALHKLSTAYESKRLDNKI